MSSSGRFQDALWNYLDGFETSSAGDWHAGPIHHLPLDEKKHFIGALEDAVYDTIGKSVRELEQEVAALTSERDRLLGEITVYREYFDKRHEDRVVKAWVEIADRTDGPTMLTVNRPNLSYIIHSLLDGPSLPSSFDDDAPTPTV